MTKATVIKRQGPEPFRGGYGAQVTQGGIRFSMTAREEDQVSLLLYNKGEEKPCGEFPMEETPFEGGLRSVKLGGIRPQDIEYNFLVNGKVVQDPAAQILRGRKTFGDLSEKEEHEVRCAIAKERYVWDGDTAPGIPYEDVIAYCMHVRGFTNQKNSKVRHRGTFRGIQEKIPYLKELGVNQLILMPAYDFNEVVRPKDPIGGMRPDMADPFADSQAKLNYWGYTGDACFFAPKQSYCATATPETEFRDLVRELHRNGMELVMEFAFTDDIGVDYILQCLTHWVRNYHVDGFMLMTRREAAMAVAGDAALARTKLMTGYFDHAAIPAGETRRRFADFNDGFRTDCRKLLKGDENMLASFVSRIRAEDPKKAIYNYIACHDGFTLADLVSYDKKYNEENGEQNRDGAITDYSWNCGFEGPTKKRQVMNLRLQQMKNAFSMLLLAQGVPMILAGDEFGNSQGGNNNPYCIDSEVTWVDWSRQRSGRELTEYVKELIAFRKAHKVLHTGKPLTGSDLISCGYPDFSVHGSRAWFNELEYQNRHVGMMYCGKHSGEDIFIYVAYNFHWETQIFALPYLPSDMYWTEAMSTVHEVQTDEEKAAMIAERMINVPGRSVRVLVSAVKEKKDKKGAEVQKETDDE